MVLKPRTIVTISPTLAPTQQVYQACFISKLRNRFNPEVVCATKPFAQPPEHFLDCLRIAMQSAEASLSGRNDLEYAAHVLPSFIEREPNAPEDMPPFPIVAITVRNWQKTEWITPYAIESLVPLTVIQEVRACVTAVMDERKSPRSLDEAENKRVETLVHDICRGIDAALAATPLPRSH